MNALQERFEALFSVGTEISSTLQLDEVLSRVTAHACRLMEARVASLLLIDTERGTLRPAATSGASDAYLALPDRALTSSLISQVITTGRPLHIPDVRKETRYRVSEVACQEGLCTLLAIPLRTKTAIIGVLNVYTGEPRCFDDDDLRLLTLLASQSAIAIENATLHRDEMATRERLRQSEKLAALGTLSSGFAHELRNPLNTVSMLMYAMGQDMAADHALAADVAIVQSELARMSLLVEQFLEFTRPRPPHFQRERIEEVMEETLLLIGPEARTRGIRLVRDWSKDLPPVWADGSQIKQVFLNLLINAMQAMRHGGALTVRLAVSGGSLLTAIRDEGEGIAPEVRAKLFEPFFSTRRGGTGLSLSISQRIIEGHNGRLCLSSQPGAGTSVMVRLPL